MEPPQRMIEAPGSRPSGSKRLKIDVACDTCRAKKVKCDGVRPACGSCSRKLDLRNKCKYSAGGFVRSREADASSLDMSRDGSDVPSQTRQPQVLPTAKTGASPELARNTSMPEAQLRIHPVPNPPPPQPSPAGTTPGSRRGDESQGQRQLGASVCSTSPSAIDSMTAVIDEGTSTGEFFGISSAGSFTAQIKKAIDIRLGKPGGGPPNDITSSTRSLLRATGSGAEPAPELSYVLPPRRQADHLMELYWFYVDPLYPFLDKKRWTHAYNAIFSGTVIDFNERIFVATLNVIFALSTQLFESQTLEQREQSSESYFQRAQGLLPMSPWEPGSLELVQCLLVTSQYLQSTYNPHQTWMVVGSAIRMAQGLGLHLPETSADRSDPVERELLRRIWYGCILMDRMVSVTHGRPAMISRGPAMAVPLPVAFTQEKRGQTMGKSMGYFSFFVESVRLYEIIHQTMITFYGGSHSGRCKAREPHTVDHEASDNDDEDLDKVVQLDRSLSKWESKLPNHLRWNSLDTNNDEISRRQAVILRMRFLHARILLLRPMLSRFCLTQSAVDHSLFGDTLQARVIEQGALFCVATAQKMITTLLKHQTSDSTVGLLPAWWYRVYYVYSAATVLIAAKLRPDIFSAVDIGRSWGQAISVLKAHEKFGQSARRCVAALHILSSKILQAVPGGLPGQDGASKKTSSRNSEGMQAGVAYDASADLELPDLVQQLADEFETPIPEFDQRGLADFNFDVNDMSWLNDVQGVWELLNE
ncbi:hypothetical protein FZEAL_666 [Fusarium zealandicum]|uniref:Zn(2)-C6 fungal-type domain-containing protein n=1 Tax=Fusarium zealandicum TaxID=1053134 RepID=A0A8H4UUQ0_9HYPO|nr:hypothetical protein FZEAL_666 [Fusarium zealandicum]